MYLFSLSIRTVQHHHKDEVVRGFVGIALALASFGIAEILGTYGFLNIFFTALFAQYHYHLQRKEERIRSNRTIHPQRR
jgi:NhaP-type Na+/H+ or K+/H+ antiporter